MIPTVHKSAARALRKISACVFGCTDPQTNSSARESATASAVASSSSANRRRTSFRSPAESFANSARISALLMGRKSSSSLPIASPGLPSRSHTGLRRNSARAADFTGAGTNGKVLRGQSIGSEGRSPLAGDAARPQSSPASHRPPAGSYPIVTGTSVIVSLPKMSMTFTAMTWRPGFG